jgi:hypothetical protein
MTRRQSSIKKARRTFENFSAKSIIFPVPKARKVAPTYTVRQPTAVAPWSNELIKAYSPLIGEDKLGKFTLSLLASAKEKGTYSSYSSNFNRFVEFCSEEEPPVHPLGASVGTICRYIAWQGLRGTVVADNLQPYLSAINRVYKDHGLEPVAQGDLVAEVIKGLQGVQVPLVEKEKRVALPAQAAYLCFVQAESLVAEMRASGAKLHTFSLFRNCLATVVSYQWFNRSDTTHSLQTSDLTVDPPSVLDPQIRLFPRSLKGRKRESVASTRDICIPVAVAPRLASLLTFYVETKREIHKAAGFPQTSLMWAIPGDTPSNWTSSIQNVWMEAALQRVGVSAPPGHSYTSHSLRSGASSAASTIGVSQQIIKYFGHWSKTSDVLEGHYIDPTFRPSAEARFFFEWLLRSDPGRDSLP